MIEMGVNHHVLVPAWTISHTRVVSSTQRSRAERAMAMAFRRANPTNVRHFEKALTDVLDVRGAQVVDVPAADHDILKFRSRPMYPKRSS